MKSERHAKIVELIGKYQIETQEREERKTNTSQVCREQFVNYLFFIYICFDFHEAGRVGE